MNYLIRVVFMLGILSLFGCQSDSDSTPPIYDLPEEPATPVLSGTVSKGPINSAVVTVYGINADGSRGSVVAGPFTTDEDGYWSSETALTGTGPFEVEALGGSYVDEATGETVTVGQTDGLLGVVESASSGQKIAVTPYTHALNLAMKDLVTRQGMSVALATERMLGSAQTAYGFDVTATLPSTASNSTTSQKGYQTMLGGISMMINNHSGLATMALTGRFEVVKAVAADLADGVLNGEDAAGNTLQVNGSDLPAVDENGLSQLDNETNTYASNQGLPTASINSSSLQSICYGDSDINTPLKMTIEDDGWFRLNTEGSVSYARYGEFCMNREGYIVDPNGKRLQGYPADGNGVINQSSPVDIVIPSENGEHSLVDIEVDLDGSIYAGFDDETEKLIGQIVLATFPSPFNLEYGSDGSCAETFASGSAVLSTPGTSGAGTLVSGEADRNAYSCNELDQFTHIISVSGDGYLRFSDDGIVTYASKAVIGLNREGYFVFAGYDYRLQGFRTDGSGEINYAHPVDVQVNIQNATPNATEEVDIGVHLDRREPVKAVALFDPADETTFSHKLLSTIYDSLGNDHRLQVYYLKTDEEEDYWAVFVFVDGELVGPTDGSSEGGYIELDFYQASIMQWRVRDINGASTPISWDTNIAPGVTAGEADTTGSWQKATDAITMQNYPITGSQATDIGMIMDFSQTLELSEFGVHVVSQDGYPSGEFSSMAIDSSGYVSVSFTNGQTHRVGRIALATMNSASLDSKTITDSENRAYTIGRYRGDESDFSLGGPGDYGFGSLVVE